MPALAPEPIRPACHRPVLRRSEQGARVQQRGAAAGRRVAANDQTPPDGGNNVFARRPRFPFSHGSLPFSQPTRASV